MDDLDPLFNFLTRRDTRAALNPAVGDTSTVRLPRQMGDRAERLLPQIREMGLAKQFRVPYLRTDVSLVLRLALMRGVMASLSSVKNEESPIQLRVSKELRPLIDRAVGTLQRRIWLLTHIGLELLEQELGLEETLDEVIGPDA